jgi:hypothetical protein
MKKVLFAVFAVLLVFGLARVDFASAGDEQDFCQVTPGVWVLDLEGTTGNELVTIHYAVDYSLIDLSSLGITINNEQNTVFDTFADERGDLVIKFYPILENLETEKSYPVLVTGFYLDGGPLDPCADQVVLKELGPAMSEGDGNFILEGDKVRGEEGQGATVQTCDTPDFDGECPYGDYNPFP